MNFRYSKHALEELALRRIPKSLVDEVLRNPQQTVPERAPKKAYQSVVNFGGGRTLLLRAIVDDTVNPAIVVTVYRTSKVSKILEKTMKVKYDPEVDVLRILFSNAPIEESDEDKPGVILDYDKKGNVVGIEILDASERMEDPQVMEYTISREGKSTATTLREKPAKKYGK